MDAGCPTGRGRRSRIALLEISSSQMVERRSRIADTHRLSQLKKQLAAKFPMDVGKYVDGKTDLLLEFLHAAGFFENELQAIRDANHYE